MNQRTELLVRREGVEKLHHSHVLIVGLGGVGGYAAEMLCRSGVGRMTIVDGDTVSESNINRQIVALHSTVGQHKAALFADRLHDINPHLQLSVIDEYLRDERLVEVLEEVSYTGVVDAIDTLSPKVFLLYHCHRLGLPVVSAMGSGGRMDGSRVMTADIADSYGCPLAAVVRKRLRRMGVQNGIRVVFSDEPVPDYAMVEEMGENKRTTLGTISYLPAIFGCRLAEEMIKYCLKG